MHFYITSSNFSSSLTTLFVITSRSYFIEDTVFLICNLNSSKTIKSKQYKISGTIQL